MLSFALKGGAPFATGSDLGGSLRTPSHFHGICSMKPTTNRLSEKGMVQCVPTSSFRNKMSFLFRISD